MRLETLLSGVRKPKAITKASQHQTVGISGVRPWLWDSIYSVLFSLLDITDPTSSIFSVAEQMSGSSHHWWTFAEWITGHHFPFWHKQVLLSQQDAADQMGGWNSWHCCQNSSTSTSKLCELAWTNGIYFFFPPLKRQLRVLCSYSTPEGLSLWLPALTCKWRKCSLLEKTRIVKLGWKKADNVLWNMECYRRQEKQLPLVPIAKISEDQTTTWEFPREQPLSQSKIELGNCLFQK